MATALYWRLFVPAPRLERDEEVMFRGWASRQELAYPVGGGLYVTPRRFYFSPTRRGATLWAPNHRLDLPFSDVAELVADGRDLRIRTASPDEYEFIVHSPERLRYALVTGAAPKDGAGVVTATGDVRWRLVRRGSPMTWTAAGVDRSAPRGRANDDEVRAARKAGRFRTDLLRPWLPILVLGVVALVVVALMGEWLTAIEIVAYLVPFILLNALCVVGWRAWKSRHL